MVSFPQIEQILEILDDADINRELIEIPLGAKDPGGIEDLGSGKVRLTVPATGDFDSWLEKISDQLLRALGELN
tara:strand:- start:379 stop:600 length:222 start_codon:yes stop_codon:yes gene_type:complete